MLDTLTLFTMSSAVHFGSPLSTVAVSSNDEMTYREFLSSRILELSSDTSSMWSDDSDAEASEHEYESQGSRGMYNPGSPVVSPVVKVQPESHYRKPKYALCI